MRNLIVCCDGTWNTPEQREGGVPVPTNVVRLYNALAETDANGNAHLRYYHPGVGTEGSLLDRAVGGGMGVGLDQNIKSAYRWVCDYFQDGDRLFLFGFSRGAYTVRSLAGLLSHCGILISPLLRKQRPGHGLTRPMVRDTANAKTTGPVPGPSRLPKRLSKSSLSVSGTQSAPSASPMT